MELCCAESRRRQQCQLGIRSGQAGRHCLRLSGVGGEAFRDCCLGCKLGLQVSAMASECEVAAATFAFPWKDSFLHCCQEIQNGTFTAEVTGTYVLVLVPFVWLNCLLKDSPDAVEEPNPANRCPLGFRYNARLNVCDDVDECHENTHECDADYEICRNTVGDYICEDLPGVTHDGHGGDENEARAFKLLDYTD